MSRYHYCPDHLAFQAPTLPLPVQVALSRRLRCRGQRRDNPIQAPTLPLPVQVTLSRRLQCRGQCRDNPIQAPTLPLPIQVALFRRFQCRGQRRDNPIQAPTLSRFLRCLGAPLSPDYHAFQALLYPIQTLLLPYPGASSVIQLLYHIPVISRSLNYSVPYSLRATYFKCSKPQILLYKPLN